MSDLKKKKIKKSPQIPTESPHSHASHTEDLVRLKRIKGQLEGVERMIHAQRYCVEIIDQMKSIFAALKSVENQMLQRHLKHCIHDAIYSSDPKRSEEKVNELVRLLEKRNT